MKPRQQWKDTELSPQHHMKTVLFLRLNVCILCEQQMSFKATWTSDNTETGCYALKIMGFLLNYSLFSTYLCLRTVIFKSHVDTLSSLFVPYLKVLIVECDHQFKR